MKRHGQAAMEFLMTYGWAILVVIVAIGALVYFGASDMFYYTPESCSIEPPFTCIDVRVDTSGLIQLEIKNNQGRELAQANVTIAPRSCDIASLADRTFLENDVPNGKNFNESNFGVLTFHCDMGTEPALDTIFEGDILVEYRVRDQIVSHQLPGEFTTRVEG